MLPTANSQPFSLDWSAWFYGLWVAVIGGASNGVVAGLGLNLMDPKDFNAQQPKFWYMVGGLFLVGGVKDFFLYLAQHPAPPVVITKSITTSAVQHTDAQTGAQTTTVSTVEKVVEKPTPPAPPPLPPAA